MNSPLDVLSYPPGTYAGIGSRESPPDVLDLMRRIAARLAELGWMLRSGAAPGADSAFEQGSFPSMRVELFLPWPRFESRCGAFVCLASATHEAHRIAAKHHPNWARLSSGGRALQARNTHQILGADCRSPSRFVVCWTPDGATTGAETSRATGGTGQAIRIASAYGVPVFNLRRADHRAAWEAFVFGDAPSQTDNHQTALDSRVRTR